MNCSYRHGIAYIEYFEEIAEQRHLGRAAQRLGLSQPALSKSLRRLEDAMQVKLFVRNAKGLELNAEGSLLLARARDLRLSLRNVAREVTDVVRVAPAISGSASAQLSRRG